MNTYKVVNCPQKLDGLKVIEDPSLMVETLKNGEAIAHWERGDSMTPLLVDSQYVRLDPIHETPQSGDIVFCKVNGVWMCHMVWIANRVTGQCLIGSTSASLYGWATEVIAIGKPMPYLEEPHEEENFVDFEEISEKK